jgi:hypothetical protein
LTTENCLLGDVSPHVKYTAMATMRHTEIIDMGKKTSVTADMAAMELLSLSIILFPCSVTR